MNQCVLFALIVVRLLNVARKMYHWSSVLRQHEKGITTS